MNESSWRDTRDTTVDRFEGWDSDQARDDTWEDRRVKPLTAAERPKASYPWFKPKDSKGQDLRKGSKVFVRIGRRDRKGKVVGSYPNGDCWVDVGKGDVRLVSKDFITKV